MKKSRRLSGLVFLLAALAQPCGAQSQAPDGAPSDCAGKIICIAKSYRAVVEHVSLSPSRDQIDADAEKALGVRIVFISSDNLVAWKLSAMKQICAGGSCAYYRKTCREPRNSCDYAVGNPAPWYGPGMVRLPGLELHPITFAITYTSPEALQRAERNIYLGLGAGQDSKSYIPADRLEISTDPASPFCPFGSTEPGC